MPLARALDTNERCRYGKTSAEAEPNVVSDILRHVRNFSYLRLTDVLLGPLSLRYFLRLASSLIGLYLRCGWLACHRPRVGLLLSPGILSRR